MHIKTRVFLLLLLVLAGVWIWKFKQPAGIPVTLTRVERGPVTRSVANTRAGTVKACRRSHLSPAAGGQVATLNVKEGDHVSKGQLLLEVWNDDLKAALDLVAIQSSSLRAKADQACYLAEGAKRDARRVERLLARSLVSAEDVDQAKTRALASQAACRAARAEVQVNQARIERANSELERTLLRAPYDGVVAEVNAELGEYVTPSPPGIPTLPAIDLLDLSCLYVSAPIDEVDAPGIHIGMPACVSLDAFPDQRCNASVRRIAPYVLDREKQARTVEVEVEIRDPADRRKLLPGYSADIEITLERHDQVLRIPTEAIMENDQVLVFDPRTSRLQARSITRGLTNWQLTEVTRGLDEGERIVTDPGARGIEAGIRVQPRPVPKR